MAASLEDNPFIQWLILAKGTEQGVFHKDFVKHPSDGKHGKHPPHLPSGPPLHLSAWQSDGALRCTGPEGPAPEPWWLPPPLLAALGPGLSCDTSQGHPVTHWLGCPVKYNSANNVIKLH